MSPPVTLLSRLLAWPASRWLAAALAVVLSLSVGGGSLFLLENQAYLLERSRTQQMLLSVRDRLDRELGNVLAMPETIAVFVEARGGMEPELLAKVVERLRLINPHLRNVGMAPDNVIRAVFPLEGNEKALGLDYRKVPEQWAAVEQAIRLRRTVVAGPITLAQGGRGLASRTPVFVQQEGVEHYWGVVSVIVNADSLFDAVGFNESSGGYRLAARRKGDASDGAFAGRRDVFTANPETVDYTLPGGRVWTLAAVPENGWLQGPQLPLLIYLLPLMAAVAMGGLGYAVVAAHQKALTLAMKDAVTGLPNRRQFQDRLEMAVLAARRYGRKGALLLIDLDRFKPVNDQYGHAAGDLLLTLVAQRLRGIARTSDSVARLGGDEFAIVLPEVARAEDGVALAERTLEALCMPFTLSGERQVAIGACVGVAFFPLGTESIASLMQRADAALYRGKNCGRGQVCVDGCEQSLQVLGQAGVPVPPGCER